MYKKIKKNRTNFEVKFKKKMKNPYRCSPRRPSNNGFDCEQQVCPTEYVSD